jgi:hypothetical protein
MDLLLVVLPALSFGVLVTVHVYLAVVLVREAALWRAVLAFVVPPLAPYFAFVVGRRALMITWMTALVAYGAALATAVWWS